MSCSLKLGVGVGVGVLRRPGKINSVAGSLRSSPPKGFIPGVGVGVAAGVGNSLDVLPPGLNSFQSKVPAGVGDGLTGGRFEEDFGSGVGGWK